MNRNLAPSMNTVSGVADGVRFTQQMKPTRIGLRAMAAFLGVAILGSATHAQTEPPSDLVDANLGPSAYFGHRDSFLHGLRNRRLFHLAEMYCRDQVDHSPRLGRKHAEWAAELIRTYALHALHVPQDGREKWWSAAREVRVEFDSAKDNNPYPTLVEIQDALTYLVQGELQREEREAHDDQSLEEARHNLRKAIRELTRIESELASASRQPTRAAPRDPPPFDQEEILSLLRNVSFHVARAYRNQGECYVEGSADRTNSLTQAIERLEQLAAQPGSDQFRWRNRLEQIACHRLMRRWQRAEELLQALTIGDLPPDVAVHGQAERIRLELAAGGVEEALRMTRRDGQTPEKASPDYALVRLETYLAAWRESTKQANAAGSSKAAQMASELIRRMEAQHGGYWMRRAEMRFAQVASGESIHGDAKLLIHAAESYYRVGQWRSAAATYDRARAEANQAGDRDQAFAAGFTAATIFHQREEFDEATQRFRNLAQDQPRHGRAPEAHLLAIYNASERYRQAPSAAETSARRKHYQKLLEEHQATWPRANTVPQVHWWLGNLFEQERKWNSAIHAYGAVGVSTKQSVSAIRAAARCYDAWLTERPLSEEVKAQQAREAVEFFRMRIDSGGERAPITWNDVTRTCATAMAKILLLHAKDGHGRAEAILASAIAGAADAKPPWRAEARGLYAIALASQGRLDDADRELRESIAAAPTQGLFLSEQLIRLAQVAPPERRRQMGELALRGIERLPTELESLSDEKRLQLGWVRASALSIAGRSQEALAALDALAKRYPRDGRVHEAHAEMLLRSSERPGLELAATKWREIEKKSRPGGGRWFRARYAQAEAYARLNDRAKAAKLIKLTRVLHPELGGPRMRKQFLDLLAKCAS